MALTPLWPGTVWPRLLRLTLDGGAGDDTIIGGDGSDILIGGDDNDTVTGGRGNDLAFLGAGNDTFIWNPGDGSDTVEGQADTDTLQFNGANVSEHIDISANGSRVRFFRDIGNVTMDLNGVENIKFSALGGADHITVNDLSGTDAKLVAIDLAGVPGSGVGDGAADTVTVNGTGGNDNITVSVNGNTVTVDGLPAQVTIDGAEATNDALVINGLGGNDTIDASALAAGHINLTIDGGDNNDTIIGSAGADVLLGGAGNDTVTGGRGNDVALLGAGNDTFIWNPGDGSDIVEGQADTDTLQFNGSNANENINISANGSRVLLTRDVGAITMDINGVENIKFSALGGADNITVNDLTGTDTKLVALDLSAPAGSGTGDGQADTVTVNGSAGNDRILISSSGASILINGLAAQVTIDGAEAANDALVINGLGGSNVIDARMFVAGNIGITINGGADVDSIRGSNHGDVLNGGAGNDSITGGTGNDALIGGIGNDLLTGGAGNDTFVFRLGFGHDTIRDFNAGTMANTSIHDVLDLRGLGISSVADLLAAASGDPDHVDSGPNAVIHIGADDITLTNVTKAALLSMSAFDILV